MANLSAREQLYHVGETPEQLYHIGETCEQLYHVGETPGCGLGGAQNPGSTSRLQLGGWQPTIWIRQTEKWQPAIWIRRTDSEKRNTPRLYFCLLWWPKWRHMMPLDNRAINKAKDIEDTEDTVLQWWRTQGGCTFMAANVALDIVRWRTFTAAPVAPHVPT